jgi:hypothetical protein
LRHTPRGVTYTSFERRNAPDRRVAPLSSNPTRSGASPQPHNLLEVLPQRRERLVPHAILGIEQRPLQQPRILAKVKAADEIRRVLATRAAFRRILQPQPRARDAVDQHLHRLRLPVDYIL